MRKIIVNMYANDEIFSEEKYNTPAQALRAADEFVGTNPFRAAHIYYENTKTGLYIRRYSDDQEFDFRLRKLQASLNSQLYPYRGNFPN